MHAGCGYKYRHTSSSQSCKQSLILERMYSTMTQRSTGFCRSLVAVKSQIDEVTPIYPAPQKAAEKKRLLLSNKVERFAVILFFIAYALTAKVKLRLAKAACKILWAFLFGNFFCGMG